MAAALEHESGLSGLAGDADMREVLAGGARRRRRGRSRWTSTSTACARGSRAMAAALGGLDALVFTGGRRRARAGDPRARGRRARRSWASASTPAANEARHRDAEIRPPGAPVRTLVLRAREDLEMARQARRRPGTRVVSLARVVTPHVVSVASPMDAGAAFVASSLTAN